MLKIDIRKQIKLILLSNFLNSMYLISVVFTLYLTHKEVGLKEIAVIYTSIKITGLILEIPSGIFSDKWGHKFTVLLGLFFKVVGYLCFAIGINLYLWILGAILLGTSTAFLSGSYESLFIEKIKKLDIKELKNYNTVRRALGLGGSTLGVLLSTLLVKYGYNIIFYITFIALTINITILLVFIEDISISSKHSNKKFVVLMFKDFFAKRNINFFSFSFISMTIVDIPIDIYILLILKNLGYTPFVSGLIISTQLLINIITGYFSIKIKNKNIILFLVRYNYIAVVFLFTLIGFINKVEYTMGVIFFISPILFGIAQPHRFQIQHENIDSSNRASILSLQSLLMVGISAVTLMTYSYITESYSFEIAISVLGIISLSFLLLNNIIKVPNAIKLSR